MSVYVHVKELPKDISKKEWILSFPNFKDDIEAYYKTMRPGRHFISSFILDELFARLSEKYDRSFRYEKMPYAKYEKIEFKNVEELCTIINRILKECSPDFYRTVLEKEIKSRPLNTSIIYYTGPFSFTDVFDKNGITEINERQIDEVLETKKKGLSTPIKKDE